MPNLPWKGKYIQHHGIVKLYELDIGQDDTRALSALTDCHVIKDKVKKMKVKLAAQVFSTRVASTMRMLVNNGKMGIFREGAIGTVEFLQFIDFLFDSLNGHTMYPEGGTKRYRCAITETSKHEEFWGKATKVLSTLTFVKPGNQKFYHLVLATLSLRLW